MSTARILIVEDDELIAELERDYLLAEEMEADIVFTRERIFDHVWGTEAVGDMSTITVYINKLREKIEDDPSDPQYIQTVWGVGYRFKK